MNFSGKDMTIQGPQINQFNNISPKAIPRSSFKRNFSRRSTFSENNLVPIFLDEILPGDDVNLKMTAFTRVTTPIKPIMDNLYLETFWFFVPNRLVWTHWPNFQGQQANPSDSVAYTIPVLDRTKTPISSTGFAVNSVYDYFGLPINVSSSVAGDGFSTISCLWNRAYDLIWNEWFRDENLQNSLTIQTGDGPDDPGTYALRARNKRKDYITSGLPSPQKGSPVTINVGGLAPVHGIGFTSTQTISTTPTVFKEANLSSPTYSRWSGTNSSNAAGIQSINVGTPGLADYPDIFADLSAAQPITINALRQAALYQQILELDNRGGTRYVEAIYARFGVVSPDFRLQRPELVGQGSTRINIYAVPQTAPTATGQTPQGNMAAFGTAAIQGDHGCRYSATEHGMLIGLANVRADLTYQQGIPKMFSRSVRLDYYEPLLNGLGEQAVLNQELYASGTATDTAVFAYQERFSEYRYKGSEITGLFRSAAATPLDIWHLSQHFTSLPALNSSFITENVPMARVIAVTTEPSFYFDSFFDYTHVRPMPIRSNPGIDRL